MIAAYEDCPVLVAILMGDIPSGLLVPRVIGLVVLVDTLVLGADQHECAIIDEGRAAPHVGHGEVILLWQPRFGLSVEGLDLTG